MYWSDTKPILPEGAESSYELKEKDLEISTSDGERGISLGLWFIIHLQFTFTLLLYLYRSNGNCNINQNGNP